MAAAHHLERVLHDDYPGDERLDDLLEALTLYAQAKVPPTWMLGNSAQSSRRRSPKSATRLVTRL